MRRTLLGLIGCVIATCALSELASAASAKVIICHRPPGNPTNLQTITVGESAVPAHLAHGDTLGACENECLDASQCDDGNLCTTDVCLQNGQCAHETVDCTDGNVCTLDLCMEDQGCVNPANNGIVCDDGNICTTADRCTNTVCVGAPVESCCSSDADCADGDACSDDLCINNSCTNTPKECPDANICNVGICNAGLCETVPVSCDDGNVCTDDVCELDVGCVSTPTATPPEPTEVSCSDGVDNDCDGLIDSNDPDCPECGSFELCNGIDDDCDGLVDEDFPGLGNICGDQLLGVLVCSSDGTQVICGEPGFCPGSPTETEVCDRCDNNHDGVVDEGFENLGTACSVGVGVCQTDGFFICTSDGTSTECSAVPGPASQEVCGDGLDNDCDGVIDEGECSL